MSVKLLLTLERAENQVSVKNFEKIIFENSRNCASFVRAFGIAVILYITSNGCKIDHYTSKGWKTIS